MPPYNFYPYDPNPYFDPYPYYANAQVPLYHPRYSIDAQASMNHRYCTNAHFPLEIPQYRQPLYQTPLNELSRELKDQGSQPFVTNIAEATRINKTFRTALWTGQYLQLTLMSIDVGDDIGLEVHHDHDQFIRIEQGEGLVQMGDTQHDLNFERRAYAGYAIFIPAGTWHNLTNTGNRPIKLYSIYAPPEHPFGTVHETKEIALAAEENRTK